MKRKTKTTKTKISHDTPRLQSGAILFAIIMPVVIPEWTPERIKAMCKEYNIKQKDLAVMLDIQPQNMNALVKGRWKIKVVHAWALTGIEEALKAEREQTESN
jgi:DNA-binding XRE family transcriptional regulator